MHCCPLFGEENAQVRVDGKGSGAQREGWGGCPRQRLEGWGADWQEAINGTISEQATSQRSRMRWEMELCAGDKDKMSQCYVVDERKSVEGSQERCDV